MTAVNSQMLALGTIAPDFSLPDVEGKVHSLAATTGPCLVMFICNHCPFVHHVREELARLGRDYDESVAIYAINSNDAETHPGDSPERMKQEALDAVLAGRPVNTDQIPSIGCNIKWKRGNEPEYY